MTDRILIVGLGSIGQRHARNAVVVGCEVIGYDPRWIDKILTLHFRTVEGGISIESTIVIPTVGSIDIGLALHPLAAIVATPPETHHEGIAAAIQCGLPLLVEKPIQASITPMLLPTIEEFERRRIPLTVGYQFRHTAALRSLKARVDAGEFGTIYAAHAEFASQKWCSHTYKADLLLEASHEFDLLRWFLGDPVDIHATLFHEEGRTSLVSMGQLRATAWRASFHLDGLAPGYRRSLTLYGTKGQGEWTFDQAENDQAYVDELAEFLRVCRGEQLAPSCTGRDGWWAVRMVEAIRKSGESGRWEAV